MSTEELRVTEANAPQEEEVSEEQLSEQRQIRREKLKKRLFLQTILALF